MDIKEQEILGDQVGAHWYYRAKAAAMMKMLRGSALDSVLDVGAGSGFFARHLLDHTAAASAICVDPNYAADRHESQHGKPIAFVRSVEHFDGRLALMMDVLEHVPDDAALLRGYAALMRPGARVLITVPAMPWMWSGHDVFLEHFRRYTLRQVDALVAACGLRRVASSYYFGFALPIAAGMRLGRRLLPGDAVPASDMRRHAAPVNALLWRLCQAELPVLAANRLAGLSVFALAEI